MVPCLAPTREGLAAFCRSLVDQTHAAFEVIFVDDAGEGDGRAGRGRNDSLVDVPDPAWGIPGDTRFRIVRNRRHTGPAGARNAGAAEARGDLLFFTDADCQLAPETLAHVVVHLADAPLLAGNTITRPRTFFGRAVALLGFPGGGSLGFDRVWRVDASGHTESISACNFAIRKNVFDELGGFDATFPFAGGEDTVLGRLAITRGFPIKYVAAQVVFHAGRESLRSFVSWQITRGRGCFHIARRLNGLDRFAKLRVWSFANSLRAAGPLYVPLVLVLWSLLVLLQGLGYGLERERWGTP